MITDIFLAHRRDLERQIEMCIKAEEIFSSCSESVLRKIAMSAWWIQICTPTREDVEEILSKLHAGKWTKKITSDEHPDSLDYEGVVEGLTMGFIYKVTLAGKEGFCE